MTINWKKLEKALLTTIGIFSVAGLLVLLSTLGPIVVFTVLFFAIMAAFYFTN